ncbi:MAG TPA: LysR family transcriptional regulator [Polyangiaceae bacterium]|nr:LysR family transcriptional regulator [Polyangiaceae bacterium]
MPKDSLANLDLNLLLIFDAVLREGSVTRAARALALSQSAVSHGLARLRHALGDPLFTSVQRGMVPTAFAARVGPAVTDALGALRGALHAESFVPQRCDDTFTLAAPDMVLAGGLGPLLESLRELAPRARLQLIDYDPMHFGNWLSSGRLDVALVPTHQEPAGLRSNVLICEEYVVIARRGHPRVRGRLSLERYLELEHVIVSNHDGAPSDIDVWLTTRGLRRRVTLHSPSFGLVPGLVAQTELICTTVPMLVRVSGFSRELQRLKPPFDVRPGMARIVWHDRTETDLAQRWFRAQVERAYGSERLQAVGPRGLEAPSGTGRRSRRSLQASA